MTDDRLIDNPAIDDLLRDGRVGEALRQPLHAQHARGDRLREFFGSRAAGDIASDSTLSMSLTLGDFLYDYARINPHAMAGIDFASREDLHDLLSFAHFAEDFAERYGDLHSPAVEGALSRFQGYVAERLVAHHYQALGHDVMFPDTSNQAGWDLLIDGDRFQVKCVASAALVREHVARYPDIPVIVNADLAEHVGHLPGVYIDAELHHATVHQLTETTLDGGGELLDFEVPWIALAISTAMGIRDLWHRETDLQGMITNVLTDTTAKIACGALGQKPGALIGFMLFGPAGGIVGAGVGAVAGGVIGRPIARTARRLLTWSEASGVHAHVRELATQAVDCFPTKLEAWQTKHALIEDSFATGSMNRQIIGQYLNTRLQDHLAYHTHKREELAMFVNEGARRFDPLEAVRKLLILIQRAAIHPHHIQAPLQRLLESTKRLSEQRRRYRLG